MPPTPIILSLKAPVKPIVARRVDLEAETLGFSAPPCVVHMKFFKFGQAWTMVVMTPPGAPPAAARWLEPFSPDSIHIAPGLSPKVLRAKFSRIPSAWEAFLGKVVIHYLHLTPDGSASLFIQDTPKKVERFLASIQTPGAPVRARKTLAGPSRVHMTARQLEIMSLAVALGYYEIPHKLTLRSLARKIGLSVGAVSELLRRGEALIVKNYMDSLSSSEWQSTGDTSILSQTELDADGQE